jgi:hypothetical protein
MLASYYVCPAVLTAMLMLFELYTHVAPGAYDMAPRHHPALSTQMPASWTCLCQR